MIDNILFVLIICSILFLLHRLHFLSVCVKKNETYEDEIDVNHVAALRSSESAVCLLNSVLKTDKDNFEKLLVWAIHNRIIENLGEFELIDYDYKGRPVYSEDDNDQEDLTIYYRNLALMDYDDSFLDSRDAVDQDLLSPYMENIISLIKREYDALTDDLYQKGMDLVCSVHFEVNLESATSCKMTHMNVSGHVPVLSVEIMR